VTAMLTRPRGLPEWCWALIGAAVLLIGGLVPANVAAHAVWDGLDVYLFLAGIIVLAELARIEGVFDWLAAIIVPAAGGSTAKLFGLVYGLGVAVTALLSNDATVLLLTPAVLALVRRAGAPALPFVFACALVANAASFVFPISNPANLVVFRDLPSLAPWLEAFWLPSLVALVCTYVALYFMNARTLAGSHEAATCVVQLSATGKTAAIAVGGSALLLILSAAIGWPVGRAAFLLGAAVLLLLWRTDSSSPRKVLRESPWSIIPLVAGLFVIVAALDRSGAVNAASSLLRASAGMAHPLGALVTGAAVTVADNIFNNLPIGVLSRYAAHAPGVPEHIMRSVLIGVDLGPNLSVTGSLATLLWLVALRREGIVVTPLRFLAVGVVVTLPALFLSLLAVR
jgi:arsenical pump membrane protein